MPSTVQELTAEDVEIAGPRGSAYGQPILADWLNRAGFSAQALRWFCGIGGAVVVEQDALWTEAASGTALGRARVASQFVVRDGRVADEATSSGRHQDRGAHPAGDGIPAPGPDQLRDRAPPATSVTTASRPRWNAPGSATTTKYATARAKSRGLGAVEAAEDGSRDPADWAPLCGARSGALPPGARRRG
jgi:hypothetical protein